MQEKLADLDISPRQMHYHLQNGLVLAIAWLMSRGKNVVNAFGGQEARDVLLWEIVLLGLLLIDRKWRVVANHSDSFCQTTFYQVWEELESMLKIWLRNRISHPVICTALAVVKGWLIIHHEFEYYLNHSLLDQVNCYLEMRLRKIFEKNEKLIKVSPVDFCAIHHALNEEFDESQSSWLLVSLFPDFKSIDVHFITIKIGQLLYLSEVLLLILDRDCKCVGKQICKHFSDLRIIRTKENFLQYVLLFRDPLDEPNTRQRMRLEHLIQFLQKLHECVM